MLPVAETVVLVFCQQKHVPLPLPSPPPPVPEALDVGRLKNHLGQVKEQPTAFCEACREEGHKMGADCSQAHLVVMEGTMVLNLR